MFTASGLIVRFLKVFEKSSYQSVKWVRYLTKASGSYQIRVSKSDLFGGRNCTDHPSWLSSETYILPCISSTITFGGYKMLHVVIHIQGPGVSWDTLPSPVAAC